MFSEADLLPLSALQHLLFCPRQCALIHVERLWLENRLTLEGRHLHQKADSGKAELRQRGGRRVRRDSPASSDFAAGVRIVRGLPLRSFRLGLSGKADVVEFHLPRLPDESSAAPPAAVPFPVEYKRGKPKTNRCDEVQLCAQAMCLEEMLDVPVAAGALFYGVTRRRTDVTFDQELRGVTLDAVRRVREMVEDRMTPPAIYEKKKCDRCSLRSLCLPDVTGSYADASRYVRRALGQSVTSDAPPDG